MAAAKSTSNMNTSSSNRRTSSEFKYRSQYDNNDDSDDEDDDDYDEEEEDLDDDESEAENISDEKGTILSEIQGSRRKTADFTFDVEQIRTRFAVENATEGTENESKGDNSDGEITAILPGNVNAGTNINTDYHDFEVEDIDSENLISDEEDDNESGFLSQI